MLLGEFVKFIILFGGFSGGGGGVTPPGPGPGPGPSPQPFPSPTPPSLPPFPDGWCPDEPPPPEVVSRAWELLPILWAQGAGTKQQEMTGGRWITYVAEWHEAGVKGVSAFRSVNCAAVTPIEPVTPPDIVTPPAPEPAQPQTPQVKVPPPGVIPIGPKPAPAPAPAPPAPVIPPPPAPSPLPSPLQTLTPAQAAASSMADALNADLARGWGGYRKSDQYLYKAFQAATGLTKDGYPGKGTMTMLQSVLAQIGRPMPNVIIYPWKAAGGYKHPNAPTLAEWNR